MIKGGKLILRRCFNMVLIILFALSATSDSFIIGLNYGMRNVKIPLLSNILIAVISLAGTYLSMAAGGYLYRLLPTVAADMAGGGILLLLGGYMLIQSLRPRKKDRCDSEVIDTDHSHVIEWREAVLLGAFLCLNNAGVGIGASIGGMRPFAASLLCAVFSFLFILEGQMAARHITSFWIRKILEAGSAVLLIFLGSYEILYAICY